MLDEALASATARHRAAEIDPEYAPYDERPLDEPDDLRTGGIAGGGMEFSRLGETT